MGKLRGEEKENFRRRARGGWESTLREGALPPLLPWGNEALDSQDETPGWFRPISAQALIEYSGCRRGVGGSSRSRVLELIADLAEKLVLSYYSHGSHYVQSCVSSRKCHTRIP